MEREWVVFEAEAEPDPRVVRTRAVVLSAATKLLSDEGSAGFTVDGVSARSGVAKTTIYRHWPTRDDLLMAAVSCFDCRDEIPDTGSVRGDLIALLSGLAAGLATEEWSKSLPAVLDRAEHDSEVAKRHLAIVRHRSAPGRQILKRGQARGEIRADADIELLAAILAGALFYQRLMAHQSTTPAQVETIVDHVLDGVAGR